MHGCVQNITVSLISSFCLPSELSSELGRSLVSFFGCSVVTDKVRVNLHHGKIEDAVIRALVQDDDGIIKLQVDVVGLDLTALIDTRQVVE